MAKKHCLVKFWKWQKVGLFFFMRQSKRYGFAWAAKVAGVTFSDSDPLLFQNFWIRVRKFFKIENQNFVQTPATIIDLTVIFPCFYLRNDHIDSCYGRNKKVTPGPRPFFPKILTSEPDPKEKRTILPELSLALWIQYRFWWADQDWIGPMIFKNFVG